MLKFLNIPHRNPSARLMVNVLRGSCPTISVIFIKIGFRLDEKQAKTPIILSNSIENEKV
ncbi:MAG: hypothetical protein GY820_01595 [Gammaproteobacteria bacterium]|nr:hypothetical protein [Gammaproteobacteria bacterium]